MAGSARSAAQRAAIAIHEKEAAPKKSSGKKAPAKKSATKKTATKKSAAKAAGKKTAAKNAAAKAPGKKASMRRSASVSKAGKDPRGGLTAAGRRELNEQTGGHLRPGVKSAADTPEKKQRKGSFLRRHFANPPGPVVKDGNPTRQALQAAAWGEPAPQSEADEKKLAEKGSKLLEEAKAGQ